MSTRTEAVQALEDAVRAIGEYALDEGSGEIVTDAVIILGAQHIDEDGDRTGRVIIFPRHGSQPPYITSGLLADGRDLLRNAVRGD